MSDTIVSGEIAVEPAMPLAVLYGTACLEGTVKSKPGVTGHLWFRETLYLVVNEQQEIILIVADDEPNVDELQEFIDAFPDHTFTGGFQCADDQGNHWGIGILPDRKVVEYTGELIWPDAPEGLFVSPALAHRLHTLLYGSAVTPAEARTLTAILQRTPALASVAMGSHR